MVDVRPEPGSPDSGGTAWLLPVKAVPGARTDRIVGPLGDRLKIRVAAPPEGGKANTAICALIAEALGVRPGAVTVTRGTTNPEKTVRIEGVTENQVRELIG